MQIWYSKGKNNEICENRDYTTFPLTFNSLNPRLTLRGGGRVEEEGLGKGKK